MYAEIGHKIELATVHAIKSNKRKFAEITKKSRVRS